MELVLQGCKYGAPSSASSSRLSIGTEEKGLAYRYRRYNLGYQRYGIGGIATEDTPEPSFPTTQEHLICDKQKHHHHHGTTYTKDG
jgi:hypothetical protein